MRRTLDEIPGGVAVVEALSAEGEARRRLLDGFTPGASLTCLFLSFDDPRLPRARRDSRRPRADAKEILLR